MVPLLIQEKVHKKSPEYMTHSWFQTIPPGKAELTSKYKQYQEFPPFCPIKEKPGQNKQTNKQKTNQPTNKQTKKMVPETTGVTGSQ